MKSFREVSEKKVCVGAEKYCRLEPKAQIQLTSVRPQQEAGRRPWTDRRQDADRFKGRRADVQVTVCRHEWTVGEWGIQIGKDARRATIFRRQQASC